MEPEPREPRYYQPFAEVLQSRNKLPHWEQSGATYFITFRLADSVPASLRDRWMRERAQWLEQHPKPWTTATETEYHRRFSTQMDKWLDAGHGTCLLRGDGCRAEVERVLQHFDGERYFHHAWVIMPNHVHVLTSLGTESKLRDVVKSWKGVSARRIHEAGHAIREATLWQEDYFDRMVRDGEHFARCVRYIRSNPAKAGLDGNQYTHMESPLAALFAERR